MNFSEQDFIIEKLPPELPEEISFHAQAPSNIALVKYWGKKGLQLPMNTSLSFTLSESKTITKARARRLPEPSGEVDFIFYFEGKKAGEKFYRKLRTFFNRIAPYAPYIKHYQWTFESQNTFPHSSGIASSASGFAALARIVMQLEKEIFEDAGNEDFELVKTSFLARLGSGSASRSVAGPVMIWGQHREISGTSDLYAIRRDGLHTYFQDFSDLIILVDKGQKQVSSTRGHSLIDEHPFKNPRIETAQKNALAILRALETGDAETFGDILEAEALMLHALMMTSRPNYLLMRPDTLAIIETTRAIRKETGIPAYFTLDAGANVHILLPGKDKEIFQQTLFSTLKKSFDIIPDRISV